MHEAWRNWGNALSEQTEKKEGKKIKNAKVMRSVLCVMRSALGVKK